MTDIPTTPGFIGLDIETTGLDPHTDLILELGIVLFNADLAPIARRSWITAGPRFIEYLARDMDPVVVEMHTASGLLFDIDAGVGVAPLEAERKAIAFLEEHDAVGWPMLGSSVTFDRGFLARRMPGLLDAIHYRSLDASSVLLAREAVTPPAAWPLARQIIMAEATSRHLGYRRELGITRPIIHHRAVDDILVSAATAHAAMTVGGLTFTEVDPQ